MWFYRYVVVVFVVNAIVWRCHSVAGRQGLACETARISSYAAVGTAAQYIVFNKQLAWSPAHIAETFLQV